MNENELLNIIQKDPENESLEFKLASNGFSVDGGGNKSKMSLYAYCVGIGNSGGGRIIFGVTDKRDILGTNAFLNIEKTKSLIYEKLGVKIGITENIIKGKRVICVDVPKRRSGTYFNFYGIPLTRVGEELREMNSTEIANIINEIEGDFSAQLFDLGIDSLDREIIKKFKNFYKEKNKNNKNIDLLSEEQFLKDLCLIDKGKINLSALILLGKENILDSHFPDSEIIFEYRNKESDIRYSERINYRESLLESLDKIWNKINSRNTIFQFQDGLMRKEIPAFNEEVVREALLNAVIHRDYKEHSSIFILQSPEKIVFKSPGGLPCGITVENIYKRNFWRNRRLAETFEKIGFVERSGQGVDLIFENTIKEGKGVPDYSETDKSEVVLKISAVVKDKEFISYLEEVNKKLQIGFSIDDLIVLEKIKEGEQKHIMKKDVQKFLNKGIVVSSGKGRGAKYLLSKEYYKKKDLLGVYTKLEGLTRDKIKEMIVGHIIKHGDITAVEVRQAFPELSAKDIDNIFQELRRAGKIIFSGKPKTGKWLLGDN